MFDGSMTRAPSPGSFPPPKRRASRCAFFFSGTPSLVMSLWNVPDVSTALLMRRIYANLKGGLRADDPEID